MSARRNLIIMAHLLVCQIFLGIPYVVRGAVASHIGFGVLMPAPQCHRSAGVYTRDQCTKAGRWTTPVTVSAGCKPQQGMAEISLYCSSLRLQFNTSVGNCVSRATMILF